MWWSRWWQQSTPYEKRWWQYGIPYLKRWWQYSTPYTKLWWQYGTPYPKRWWQYSTPYTKLMTVRHSVWKTLMTVRHSLSKTLMTAEYTVWKTLMTVQHCVHKTLMTVRHSVSKTLCNASECNSPGSDITSHRPIHSITTRHCARAMTKCSNKTGLFLAAKRGRFVCRRNLQTAPQDLQTINEIYAWEFQNLFLAHTVVRSGTVQCSEIQHTRSLEVGLCGAVKFNTHGR